jgi:uncharacterized protein YciI
MFRTLLLSFVMSLPLLAQPAPLRQFLLRIEPVRKDFTLLNMTEEERSVIEGHVAYLTRLLGEGKLTFAGQAFDPKGLFGIIVVNAPDMDSATALMNADPGLKSKLFRGEVIPFRTVFQRACESPKKG